MLIAGDIYEVVDTQSFGLQEIKNIFHYIVTDVVGNPTLLQAIIDFVSSVIDLVKIIQSNSLTHTNVSLKNISNGIDYREESISVPGTGGTGEALPIHDAYSIKLAGASLITKPGGKRLAGALEADQTGGVTNLPLATRNIVSGALKDPFISDNGLGSQATFTPVIVGRDPLGAYDLTRINTIGDAVFRVELSTQRTRKLPFTA